MRMLVLIIIIGRVIPLYSSSILLPPAFVAIFLFVIVVVTILHETRKYAETESQTETEILLV